MPQNCFLLPSFSSEGDGVSFLWPNTFLYTLRNETGPPTSFAHSLYLVFFNVGSFTIEEMKG